LVTRNPAHGRQVAQLISESGLSIYDLLDPASPIHFDILVLEEHLREQLVGRGLNYPLRTRAKYSKSYVAEAMGYPIPKTFAKTRPRFLGQNLDVYVQKANNLQIWNEEVDALRRYAIIRVDNASLVSDVRVVTGEALALLDTTGTLTQKYQASRRAIFKGSKLVSPEDTDQLRSALLLADHVDITSGHSPTARPEPGSVLPISRVFEKLQSLIGTKLRYGRLDQERKRGAVLHCLASQALGYQSYADTGQFPDILNQALEVKLQTLSTIDLGLVSPDSESPAQEVGEGIRHRDVRYAVFFASRIGDAELGLDEVVVVTGEEFFTEFQRFEGKVTNKKIQIPLPSDFFFHAKG
jgi:hypothetical protein